MNPFRLWDTASGFDINDRQDQMDLVPEQPSRDTSGMDDWAVRLSGLLNTPSDDNTILWRLANLVAGKLDLDDFIIYVREGSILVQVAAVGAKANFEQRLVDPISIPVGHAIVGQAAEMATSVYVPDVSEVPGYVADQFEGLSEFSVPVTYAGQVIGVFDSESRELEGFNAERRSVLEATAILVAPHLALWKLRRDEKSKAERVKSRQAEALSTFAGTITHDLNNILAVVELGAESLRSQSGIHGKVGQALSDAVERARILTGRLLTLTTAGPLNREVIDVYQLLENAISALQLAPAIEVETIISPDLPLILGDAAQVPQIVTNLVVNAIEAIGDEGGTVTVKASTYGSDPPMLIIEVKDDGPGIDDQTISRIFDPYFTTKADGLGLGLASASWSALQHDGMLRVASEPGVGTVFTLTLPGQSGRLVRSPPAPRSTQARNYRLLVLEDDPLVAECLVDLLTEGGHVVSHLSRGEEAPAIWQAAADEGAPFDIAILDLRNEEGLGGQSTLRLLQEIDEGVKAIAMSGYADSTLSDVAATGFSGMIAKPFTLSDLLGAVDRIMETPTDADHSD